MELSMPDEAHRIAPSNNIAFDLHDIFYNAFIGIFVSTPDGRLLFANPALARMYGYVSPEEFLVSVTDIAAKVYVKLADRAEFQLLMDTHGQAVDHECLFRRKDGSVFWGGLNARVVRDPSGMSRHYQGFIIDITERKRTEEALLKSEKKYRGLVEGLNEAVYRMTLPEGRYEYFSSSVEDVFGFSSEEFIN
jgi:PAS domain S-box-containing protein